MMMPEKAETASAESPERGASRCVRWQLLGAITLLSLLSLRFPEATLTTAHDDSWNAALVFAHGQHLRFGEDMVFTYGPLGRLGINCFVPEGAVTRLVFVMFVSLATVSGLCLAGWRMKPGWRLLWLGFFVFISEILHWTGDDLFMELGLFAWGLLCFLEEGRRPRICLVCLATLAVVAALVKFTLAVVAAITLGAVALHLALRGSKRLAGAVLVVPALGWLAAWVALGQGLGQIPAFLKGWSLLASAYNQAMFVTGANGWAGLAVVGAAFAVAALRVAAMPRLEGGHPHLRRGLILAWLAAVFFLAWKYGYVRADHDHLALFLAFVPVVALGLEALPVAAGRSPWPGRVAAIVCAAAALLVLHSLAPNFAELAVKRTGRNLGDSLGALTRTDGYVRDKLAALRVEEEKAQLPAARALIGKSTVDVFGQFQIYAFFNGLNYRPRPVFQSYLAYSRPLMELNERFYLSANAPEFVLFDLEPINDRFPPLEDALALRGLLRDYELAGAEDRFLILRRARNGSGGLKLLREGDAQWGERIDVADYGATNLWLEIAVKPTWAGRLRQVLYKPPETHLAVWTGTNGAPPKRFRAPVPMLNAGFLANPLVLTNGDVANLYRGAATTPASAYAVESASGWTALWQDRVHYRLYQIESRPGGAQPEDVLPKDRSAAVSRETRPAAAAGNPPESVELSKSILDRRTSASQE